jgi:catecholate siderophore receptor
MSGIIEHHGRSGFSVRNHSRFADYRKMYQNVYPGPVHADSLLVDILGYNNRMSRTNLFNQTDLTYRARTWGVTHTLLAGAELGRQATDAFRNTGYFNNTSTSFAVPVADPISTGAPVTFRQSATDVDAHTTALVASGYVQDQVTVIPQLLLLAGLRFDNFDLRYHNNRTNADLSRVDRMVSPRLGMVIKPARDFSLYGSYGVSFLPSSGSLFTSLTVTTQNLKPEGFTNYEVGAKWDIRPALSVNVAAYLLDRTNTSAPDPLDPAHTVQTGSQRSKGIELGVAGNVTNAWEILAGYTLMDARITTRTSQAPAGAVVPLAPRHSFSVWNRYDVNRLLGIGAGVTRQSSRFAAIDNTVTLPGFTEVDAAVYVRISRVLRAQVNVENLFDVRYFPTANSNNNITPGSPRTARMVWTVQP